MVACDRSRGRRFETARAQVGSQTFAAATPRGMPRTASTFEQDGRETTGAGADRATGIRRTRYAAVRTRVRRPVDAAPP